MVTRHQVLLRELEDQKHALDLAAIVAATDRYGRLTYVNDKFCEISEYSRSELLGQTHRIVNSQTHTPDFFSELWAVITSGQVWRGEICNRTKSGRLYWVQTTIVPFVDDHGNPYQYLSIRQDITALKAAERTILDQQACLVASSRMTALGELSAALTHEINNPLAVILGRAEMLERALGQDQPDLDVVQSMVRSIKVTGERIEKIMRTVRSLAHGTQGESPQLVSLEVLISSVVDILGVKLQASQIRLEVSLHDPALTLFCLPTEIFQILANLLSNAHDAVKGTRDPWVRLQTLKSGSHLQIRVSDSGAGVAPENKAHIFRPFFTTKKSGVGTGLGLTISQDLAKRSGYTLQLDESSSETCFYLSIPCPLGPA